VSKTRERIVDQLDVLFHERGFEATSLADIAGGLGLSRGTFYSHFKTKDEILNAVMDLGLFRTAAMLTAWEAESDMPLARITCVIRILIRNRAKIMSWSCPVSTLVSELSKLEHAAQARAAELFALLTDWLETQFRTTSIEQDAKALATHLMGRSLGVAALAQAFGDKALIEAEVAQMTDWVEQKIATQAP